jgi:dTDP-4-amino-4,6-dideoxygalactose transaminase
LPLAHTLASEVLSLPMGPHLHMTEVQSIISEMCNAV